MGKQEWRGGAMTARDCLFDSQPKDRLASGRLKGYDTVVEEVQNNIKVGWGIGGIRRGGTLRKMPAK